MKILAAFLLLALLFTSCEGNKVYNRMVEKGQGSEMLVGAINRDGLESHSFAAWYTKNYDAYTPDSAKVAQMQKKLRRYRLEVFLGTWCGDSQREVPRLMKILDQAKFPMSRVKMYAVNREKKSFYGEEINKNIQMVPTIIFYTEGKEVNRIIEYPVGERLESDIWDIVNDMDYVPNYSNL